MQKNDKLNLPQAQSEPRSSSKTVRHSLSNKKAQEALSRADSVASDK